MSRSIFQLMSGVSPGKRDRLRTFDFDEIMTQPLRRGLGSDFIEASADQEDTIRVILGLSHNGQPGIPPPPGICVRVSEEILLSQKQGRDSLSLAPFRSMSVPLFRVSAGFAQLKPPSCDGPIFTSCTGRSSQSFRMSALICSKSAG